MGRPEVSAEWPRMHSFSFLRFKLPLFTGSSAVLSLLIHQDTHAGLPSRGIRTR